MGYVDELRAVIGHRPILMPGIRAVIRDERGAVLLQLRSDFRIWGLPAGGMEIGESVVDTLRREVLEATGLTVVRARPFSCHGGRMRIRRSRVGAPRQRGPSARRAHDHVTPPRPSGKRK